MLSRILMLASRQSPPTVAPETPAPPIRGPLVDVVAFAADCAIVAQLRLEAPRFSDMLNAGETYALSSALVEAHDDGRLIEVPDLEVERDELLLIQIKGPRGDRGRRLRTSEYPVEMQVGPYRVHGYVHVRPGGDPLRSFRRRDDMVPLTEAWVSYLSAGTVARLQFRALAVNRLWVDWIAESTDDVVETPSHFMPQPSGPLLKDFTGHVLGKSSSG